MSFTVSDLQELLTILREHPEWCDAVRREVLSDELLALPRAMGEMAEAQARTDARLDCLTEVVARLSEEVTRLQQVVSELGHEVTRLGQETARLGHEVTRLGQETARLGQEMNRMSGRMGNVEGELYEQRYRDNVGSRLGRRLRHARRVDMGQIAPLLDALDRGIVSDGDWDDVAALDILVKGRAGAGPDAPERFIALEVSITIDRGDVERAHRRSRILGRCGLEVEPYVAGREITTDAHELAASLGVSVLLDRAA